MSYFTSVSATVITVACRNRVRVIAGPLLLDHTMVGAHRLSVALDQVKCAASAAPQNPAACLSGLFVESSAMSIESREIIWDGRRELVSALNSHTRSRPGGGQGSVRSLEGHGGHSPLLPEEGLAGWRLGAIVKKRPGCGHAPA